MSKKWQVLFGALSLLPSVLPAASPVLLREQASRVTAATQQPMWMPIHLYHGYLVIVEGKVGSLPEQNLLIDTGTAPSILNASVARALNLEVAPARLAVMNDLRVAVGKTVLPALEVGPIQASSLPVLVRDLSAEERTLGVPIAAVIGLDVLGRSNFRLEYSSKRIVFGEVSPVGISLPFAAPPPFVSVEVVAAGQTVRVLVDTGSAGLVLFQSRVGDRFPGGDMDGSRNASNMAGRFLEKEVRPGDIVIGGKRFSLRKAFLATDQQDASREFDGLMGVGAMGFKAITFDFEARNVYLQP